MKKPEAVHEVIIRAERRKFRKRGNTAEDSKGNGIGKDIANS